MCEPVKKNGCRIRDVVNVYTCEAKRRVRWRDRVRWKDRVKLRDRRIE